MSFFYTIIVILLLTSFISWLNYRLLTRLFPIYRAQVIRYIYLTITTLTVFVLGYGWARRPPFVVTENAIYPYLVYIAVAWLFSQLILLLLQPFIYVTHRLIKGKKAAAIIQSSPSLSKGVSRREFLHNALAMTPFLGLGISTKGIYEAQSKMVLKPYSLKMSNLPSHLKGFKIGQMSDIHLGPYFDFKKLDLAIQVLAESKPDLVVITGDFADDLNFLTPAIDRLSEFAASIPHGMYFCLGNHDYFHDLELVRSELNKSRIKNLENESVLLISGETPFYLLGVEYPWSGEVRRGINISASKRQEFFAQANQNIPDNAFKVFIAHHPDALIDGFANQIPLTLTGHTHGGQLAIGGKSLMSNYTYMLGLYQENGVYGYVSAGTGHWFPIRLGCPPEVSVFMLDT